MACEVAMLNPQLDMNTPVAIAEGFYSPQHWSSADMSPQTGNYANSPIQAAGSPNSCAARSPSYGHSPVMAAHHSPNPVVSLSPVHSPPMLQHAGSPHHMTVKQEGEFACAVTEQQMAAVYGKPHPPELISSNVFPGAEGEGLFCFFLRNALLGLFACCLEIN